MTFANSRQTRRLSSAFTLIELLVVLGLILVLTTLAAAVIPRTQEKQKVVNAASQIQGWLLAARQMAMRDQAPRGLRLNYTSLTAPPNGGATYAVVNQLAYIEQPDPYAPLPSYNGAGQPIYQIAVASNINVLTTPIPPLVQGWPAGSTFASVLGASPALGSLTDSQTKAFFTQSFLTPQSTVQPGCQGGILLLATPGSVDFSTVRQKDLLELNGGGQSTVFPILQIGTTPTTNNPNPANLLVTGPPSITAIPDPRLQSFLPAGDFRILRQPWPKSGEPLLQLPANVYIDLTSGSSYAGGNLPFFSSGSTTGSVDILFSPSGEVISAGLPSNDLRLWLRDVTEDSVGNGQFGGPQYIVVIRIRTGTVSVQPVDITPNKSNSGYNDPYSFTYDGVDSGV